MSLFVFWRRIGIPRKTLDARLVVWTFHARVATTHTTNVIHAIQLSPSELELHKELFGDSDSEDDE